MDISHEEFKTIVNEKENNEQMKENIKNTKGTDEKGELNEKSRNSGNTQIKKYIYHFLL